MSSPEHQAWRERKREELSVLQSHLDEPLELGVPATTAQIADAKFRLRGALLAGQARSLTALRETAISADHQRIGPWSVEWGYQRYDLQIKGPKPRFDGLSREHFQATRTMTASGMSAISAVALALQHDPEISRVVSMRGVYLETRYVLDRLTPGLDSIHVDRAGELESALHAGPAVLWLDSYGPVCHADVLDDLSLDNVQFVVFDTTCYRANDALIGRAVARCLAKRVPMVAVRSCIKLDQLGIELGRLGSTTFIVRRDATKPELTRVAKLASEHNVALTLLGGRANPLHLPPFAGTPAFERLTRERVAHIRKENRAFHARLSARCGDLCRVHAYHHALFSTVESLGSFDPEPDTAAFAAFAEASGLPVRVARSFGFDIVAVDAFTERRGGEVPVMRVAVGDVAPGEGEAVADAVVAWLGSRS